MPAERYRLEGKIAGLVVRKSRPALKDVWFPGSPARLEPVSRLLQEPGHDTAVVEAVAEQRRNPMVPVLASMAGACVPSMKPSPNSDGIIILWFLLTRVDALQ